MTIHEYIIEELMLELEDFISVKSRYWDGPRNKITKRYLKYINEQQKENCEEGYEFGVSRERKRISHDIEKYFTDKELKDIKKKEKQ